MVQGAEVLLTGTCHAVPLSPDGGVLHYLEDTPPLILQSTSRADN
jgi:hypothetical protein